MKFEIENLLDIVTFEMTTKDELISFINSSAKLVSSDFEILVNFPVINTLKKHPEWLKDIFKSSIADSYINKILLQACVALLYKDFVSSFDVVNALKSYNNNISSIGEAKCLQKILLRTDNLDSDFRIDLYKKIFGYYYHKTRIQVTTDIIKFIIKDFYSFDFDLIAKLAYIINENDSFRNEFLHSFGSCDKKTVLDFLSRFIHVISSPANVSYHICWGLVYKLIEKVLENDISLLIEKIKDQKSTLLNCSAHADLWRYLTDISDSINFKIRNIADFADAIPCIPEEKFFKIVEQCKTKMHDSIYLLNNSSIVKNKERYISILKTYLNSMKTTFKNSHPLIPIERDILHKLSTKQLIKLAIRSSENQSYPVPIRFTYTAEAFHEMKKRLTIASMTGICRVKVLENFTKAHGSTLKVKT